MPQQEPRIRKKLKLNKYKSINLYIKIKKTLQYLKRFMFCSNMIVVSHFPEYPGSKDLKGDQTRLLS